MKNSKNWFCASVAEEVSGLITENIIKTKSNAANRLSQQRVPHPDAIFADGELG